MMLRYLFLLFMLLPAITFAQTGKMDTSFTHQRLELAPGLEYQVIFTEGSYIKAPSGALVGAKGKHDYIGIIPQNSNGFLMWVNHETNVAHDELGDGGGATVIPMKKTAGGWEKDGMPYAVDFSPVEGTAFNCLGAVTPWGTVITSEEALPFNREFLYRNGEGIRAKMWGDRPVWYNFGWMVEADPVTGKALRKLHGMGRFMHEGAYCMPDSKTVYLLDDDAPGLFFKFVADKAGTYESGRLHFYKQLESGTGEWEAIPAEFEVLANVREYAIAHGATVFIRLEDMEPLPDGRFLITETGIDKYRNEDDYGNPVDRNMAAHLAQFKVAPGTYSDIHGRILVFDPRTNKLEVWLEGGQAETDSSIILSNPDNISISPDGSYLTIHEDINWPNKNRVPMHAEGTYFNEVYILPLSGKPSLDKLERIAVAPPGGETTGPAWAPDGSAFFFNIQHPGTDNPFPFDRSMTVMITGMR